IAPERSSTPASSKKRGPYASASTRAWLHSPRSATTKRGSGSRAKSTGRRPSNETRPGTWRSPGARRPGSAPSARSSGLTPRRTHCRRRWLRPAGSPVRRATKRTSPRLAGMPARSNGRTTLIELEQPVERAFLVAVDTGTAPGWNAEDSLAELANLALTAGADVVGAEWQNRRHVDPHWYVGKGKAEELVAAKSETGFDLLVADDELSPTQQKMLEGLVKTKVIDRSRLILDIFAQHARTHEGRLQVELAQLEYQLPRLTRLWTHLSRTGGGIGTRGPGESQLETDRPIIRDRTQKMKERVEEVNRADVLVEVVDAADPHLTEHRATVQAVLDDLGAGAKPRLVAYNKADLLDPAASGDGVTPPAVGGAVSISALTGFGLDTLRTELSALLASLWVDIDVRVPYTAGELLARVRERGTIVLDYLARDVRVRGRVPPAG